MSWSYNEYMSRLKKGLQGLNQATQSVTSVPLPTEFNDFMERNTGKSYEEYVANHFRCSSSSRIYFLP